MTPRPMASAAVEAEPLVIPPHAHDRLDLETAAAGIDVPQVFLNSSMQNVSQLAGIIPGTSAGTGGRGETYESPETYPR